jgi:hypothetical protein
MDDIERLWTHKETARYLHVSAWTLTELVQQKNGPTVYRVGRNRRYDPVNVWSWLHRNATTSDAGSAPVGRHVQTGLGSEKLARSIGVQAGQQYAIDPGQVIR